MFRDENSVSDLRNRIASVPNTKVEASNPKDGGVSARIAITGSAR
jgi:hypothetical protein